MRNLATQKALATDDRFGSKRAADFMAGGDRSAPDSGRCRRPSINVIGGGHFE
jgi:hypothetical protein